MLFLVIALDEMKKAIIAILLHSMSTKDSFCHIQCPTGPESWCYHNKAIAEGNSQTAINLYLKKLGKSCYQFPNGHHQILS